MSQNNISPLLKSRLEALKNQAPSDIINTKTAPLPNDSVQISKKMSKGKKIALITGIAALCALITAAIIKRRDIAEFFSRGKEKITNITLPDEKGYDLSNEADKLGSQSYTASCGFQEHIFDKEGGYYYSKMQPENLSEEDKLLYKIMTQSSYGSFGIADEHAYVKYRIGRNGADAAKFQPQSENAKLCEYVIISPDKNFTPAQKNLLALMQQGRYTSENSPSCLDYSAELTRGHFFEMLAKWAQDIDMVSEDTITFLNSLAKIKNGQCVLQEPKLGFEISKIR